MKSIPFFPCSAVKRTHFNSDKQYNTNFQSLRTTSLCLNLPIPFMYKKNFLVKNQKPTKNPNNSLIVEQSSPSFLLEKESKAQKKKGDLKKVPEALTYKRKATGESLNVKEIKKKISTRDIFD